MKNRGNTFKRIFAISLVLSLLASIGLVQTFALSDNTQDNYIESAELVSDNDKNVSDLTTATTTIQIIHTNDIHGYYTKTDRGVIGFAQLKTLVDSVGADLVLDAGDTYHGQAFATVEQGLGIAELMKSVGYDAMTPGNHDWSYGANRLKELEAVQGFPVLAANVTDDSENAYFDTPYLVKTVTADDGTQLKVGVVGVIDDEFYNSTATENVSGLSFKEEAETASKIASTLKNQEKCDIVIALTHNANCESFVNNLSNVDTVIAGHQHILIDTAYQDKDGKNVPVVESGYYFYDIGTLSLTYDSTSKTISKATEKNYTSTEMAGFAEDTAVAAQIKTIEVREASTLSKVIGTSSKDYAYSWEEIRVAEQEIGRIVTAAYIDRTGADVAFENAGGIRGGIKKGDITYKDLISISPYGNTIVTKELSGKQILDLVEYSLELSRQCDEIYALQKQAIIDGEDPYQYSWPSNSGSVLQFGGITVKYDMSKPQGSRIVSAEIGGKAVDLTKIYTVATNNYVADNTEYPGISGSSLVKEYGTCEQALINYISKGTFEIAAAKANLSPYVAVPETKPDKDPIEDDKKDELPSETTTKPAVDATQQQGNVDIPSTGKLNSTVQWVAFFAVASGVLTAVSAKKSRKNNDDE